MSKAQMQLDLFHLEKMNSSTLICSRREQTCAFTFRADTHGHVYLYVLMLSLGLCSSSSFARSYGARG